MMMPRRVEFGKDTNSFLRALDGWRAANEAAYHHLHGMYDANEPVSVKPKWLEDFSRGYGQADTAIRHVEAGRDVATESVIEAALRNLAGNALQSGLTVIRLCHGEMNKGFWSCYALLKADK